MNYENEHLIIDYLDNYFRIDNDKIYSEFKPNGEFATEVVKSISKILNLNKNFVEFILSGWVTYNGMSDIGWKDSKDRIIRINCETRQLRVTWTRELAQDLGLYHNIDAEGELTAMLSEQVAAELDRTILEEFRPRLSIASRYASKIVNKNYYSAIYVSPIITNNDDDTTNDIRWEDYFRPEGPYNEAQVAKFLEENGYGSYRWGRFGLLRLVPKETIQHYSEPTITWGTHIFHKRFNKGFEWWEGKREGTNPYVGTIEGKIPWNENSSYVINRHTNRWEPLVVGNARGREDLFTQYTKRSWFGPTILWDTHEPWLRC